MISLPYALLQECQAHIKDPRLANRVQEAIEAHLALVAKSAQVPLTTTEQKIFDAFLSNIGYPLGIDYLVEQLGIRSRKSFWVHKYRLQCKLDRQGGYVIYSRRDGTYLMQRAKDPANEQYTSLQ